MKIIRHNKGCFIKRFPKTFVLIDLETTGLSPMCDEIIEFAGIKVVDGEVVAQFQELAKPSYPIPGFIEEITGITNDMVKDARSVGEVYEDFIKFVGGEIIVGHNVSFDINFLYDFGHPETLVSNDYVDTLHLSRFILPGLESHRLDFLCEVLNLNNEDGYHRALFDCVQTLKLYRHLQTRMTEEELIAHYEERKRNRKRYVYHHGLDLKSIHATVDPGDIDKTNPFYGKSVVFTGALDRFERKDAAQIVVNLGGVAQSSITKKTDFLVLGKIAQGFCL